MGSTVTAKHWADGPFKLIQTPEFREKPSKVDPYIRTASVMAVYHNMLIRGLNSIYLQAPHVAPNDYHSFIAYSQCWYENIDSHHRGEETGMFPKIEEAVGEKGLLHVNVEQHGIFEPGVEAFHAYLSSLAGRESDFSGTHLRKLIDAFAPALLQHLSDEIPSLLSLRKYGSSLPILEITSREGRAASSHLAKTGPIVFFMLNLDVTFEDGLWSKFPPIPGPVRWALVRALASWNRSWWRFASCDCDGKPKELFALGKE